MYFGSINRKRDSLDYEILFVDLNDKSNNLSVTLTRGQSATISGGFHFMFHGQNYKIIMIPNENRVIIQGVNASNSISVSNVQELQMKINNVINGQK